MALSKHILVLIFISSLVIFATCKNAHSAPSHAQVAGSIQPEDEKAKPTEKTSDITGMAPESSDEKDDSKDKKKDGSKDEKGESKDKKKGDSKDEKKSSSKDEKKKGSKDEKGESKDEKKGSSKDEKKDGSNDEKKDGSKDEKKGGSKDEKGDSKDEKKGGSKDKKGDSKDEKKGGSKDEKSDSKDGKKGNSKDGSKDEKGDSKDEKKGGSKYKKKDNSTKEKKDDSNDKKGDSKDEKKGGSKDENEGDSTNEKEGDVATVVTKQMRKIEEKINEFNALLKKQMDNPGSSSPGSHECVLECDEVLGAALDDIKKALESINNQNLVKANFDVSAVSTNVDTCNDCFEEMVGGDPEAKKLTDWVQKTTGDALVALKTAES